MENEAIEPENEREPDLQRLSRLSIGIGAFFALSGIVIFLAYAVHIFIAFGNDQSNGFSGDQKYLLRFFFQKGGIWALVAAFSSFIALTLVATRAVKNRVLANRGSRWGSWLYALLTLWASSMIGYLGILIADSNNDFFEYQYLENMNDLARMSFGSGIISAIFAVPFSKLLTLAFRGLMTAPGFGIPRE